MATGNMYPSIFHGHGGVHVFDHLTVNGHIVSIFSAIIHCAKLSVFSFLVDYFLEVNF